MATVTINQVGGTRNYDDTVAALETFIGTLAAADTVYTCQIIRLSDKIGVHWIAVIIWSDDAP